MEITKPSWSIKKTYLIFKRILDQFNVIKDNNKELEVQIHDYLDVQITLLVAKRS
jgi:hypothetical protein